LTELENKFLGFRLDGTVANAFCNIRDRKDLTSIVRATEAVSIYNILITAITLPCAGNHPSELNVCHAGRDVQCL